MHTSRRCAVLLIGIAVLACAVRADAQHTGHAADTVPHSMWSAALGGGWSLAGMAQAYPILTVGAPGVEGSALRATAGYLTQPVLMTDLISPGTRFVLRTTLDLEGLTQPDGELTFGAWGEGFIDRRHPHTLLHELVLAVNVWETAAGSFSLAAGRGFAPYGPDDPMSRPGLKYPTNHHLSQILERWLVSGAFLGAGWSLEAGLLGGAEPEGPYDFGGIDSFGDSWSLRMAKRWGSPASVWEASVSHGSVADSHDGETVRTRLWNATLRYERNAVYALLEASHGDSDHDDAYFSLLGEARVSVRSHQPYARIELATRPEYARDGTPGTPGFFRYDHDAEAAGATRWLIGTLAYAYELTPLPVSVRPFVEAQFQRVRPERGGIDPRRLYGTDAFWSVSLGARIFLGGGPMRMGAYGVLDPMTTRHSTGVVDDTVSHRH